MIEVEDDSDDAAPSAVAVASSDSLGTVVPGPVLAPVVLGHVPRPADSYQVLLNHGVTKLYHF